MLLASLGWKPGGLSSLLSSNPYYATDSLCSSEPSLDLWPQASKETWVWTRHLPRNQMLHLQGASQEGSMSPEQSLAAWHHPSFFCYHPEQFRGVAQDLPHPALGQSQGPIFVHLNSHGTCGMVASYTCRLCDLGQYSLSLQSLFCSSLLLSWYYLNPQA